MNLIYLPIVLKPKIIKLKAILWSLYNNEFYVDHLPDEGRVIVSLIKTLKQTFIFLLDIYLVVIFV